MYTIQLLAEDTMILKHVQLLQGGSATLNCIYSNNNSLDYQNF